VLPVRASHPHQIEKSMAWNRSMPLATPKLSKCSVGIVTLIEKPQAE
jgi:hypothetical protein